MQPTDVYVADGYVPRSREREAKLLEAVEAVAALVDTVDDAILRGARLQAAATLLASGRVRSSMEAAEMVHILEYDLETVTERDGGVAQKGRRRPKMGVPNQADVLLGHVTEAQLQAYVEQVARLYGYLVMHQRYALKSESGFPDLTMVSAARRRTLFVELKREGKWPTVGRLARTPASRWVTGQDEWLGDLLAAGNEVYLWWPSDRQDLVTVLDTGPVAGMPCVGRLPEYLARPRGA